MIRYLCSRLLRRLRKQIPPPPPPPPPPPDLTGARGGGGGSCDGPFRGSARGTSRETMLPSVATSRSSTATNDVYLKYV